MQLATGAWFEPQDSADDNAICIHGNPNILTRDIGTSKLSQGSTGQIARVEIELFTGDLPPVRIFEAMTFALRDTASSAPGHPQSPA
jgi:biotin/methionine sulfoxide reductase